MSESNATAPDGRRGARIDALLLSAAFVSGGALMTVEIVGSRVLGPFFGVGLFVWSALLAVALGSLALGYFAGGVLADRRRSATLVFELALLSGVLVALIAPCSRAVLSFSDSLGIRAGALLSALLLFGPGLTAMGMLTTVATREVATKATHPGRNIGVLYATSTLGSLAGTLLTGFVLVPHFALHDTLAVTAALLIVVGAMGRFVRSRSRRGGAALVFPLLSSMASPNDELGTGIRVLERSESLHGRLSVIEDESRGSALRLLRADHSFIGGRWTESGEPAFGFVHILEAVRLARPEGRDLLQIGLGIGSVPMSLAKFGVQSDVVEIDPEVIRLAREHFAYAAPGETFAEDARTFIRHLDKRYDFVIHDAFTAGAVPEHLLSLEVLRRLGSVLKPGGVLALNLVGAESGPLSGTARAVSRTLREAFSHVRVFRDGPPSREPISNLIFFASSSPVRFTRPGPVESETCGEILASFQSWEVTAKLNGAAPLITDERNPVLLLGLRVSEEFRAAMRRLYPPSFWLE